MVRSFNKVTTLTICLMAATIALAIVARSYAVSHSNTSGLGADSQFIQILPSTELSANTAGTEVIPVVVNGQRHDIAPGETQTFSDNAATTTISNDGTGVTTTTTTNPPAPIQTNGSGNVSVSTSTNNSNSNTQSYSGISSSSSSWITNGGQSFVYSNGNGNVVITH